MTEFSGRHPDGFTKPALGPTKGLCSHEACTTGKYASTKVGLLRRGPEETKRCAILRLSTCHIMKCLIETNT